MRCVPIQQNKNIIFIFAALLLLGGISYALPIACDAYGIELISFPFGVVTLFSLSGAVYVLIRYRMMGFVYIIRPRSDIEENGMETAAVGRGDICNVRREFLDFVVIKTKGIRPGVMECVMSLGDLFEVVPLYKGGATKKDVRQKYIADGFVFYDYTLTLGIKSALELVFDDGNRYVGVIIEPDNIMREYFMSLDV